MRSTTDHLVCAVLSSAADSPWLYHVQLCSYIAVMEKFIAVLVGLFKGAVGKEENKMNLVPSILKGSFGRSLVGRDGVPKRLSSIYLQIT